MSEPSIDLVGRIVFGPRTPMSELRRVAVTDPVTAAHALNRLRQERDALRSALRDAMAFVDRETAKDYERWQALLNG